MASNEKLFVVQKYVMAKDIPDALRKEVRKHPDCVYLDEEWRKNQWGGVTPAVGFALDAPLSEEEL
jgi:hypothetical protein